MTRFLYALAFVLRPTGIVVAGSHVAYGLAWLAMGSVDAGSDVDLCGYDIDPNSNRIARTNAAALPLGPRASKTFVDADALTINRHPGPIDLLLLDVDHPKFGKRLYRDVFLNAQRVLSPAAVILAHDATLGRFAEDLRAYDSAVRSTPGFRGPLALALDKYGISVTLKEAG